MKPIAVRKTVLAGLMPESARIKLVLRALFALFVCSAISACGQGGSVIGGSVPGQGGKPVSPSEFITGSVWFFLLGLAVYYILVLKPGFEEEDRQKKFVDELKKNDEVMTVGGVFGRVFAITPDFITVEVAPNVRLKVAPNKLLPAKLPQGKSSGSKTETGPAAN